MEPQAATLESDSPSVPLSERDLSSGVPPIAPPDRLPDISNIVIRDDAPVESIFAEKQYKLFSRPLYVSWKPPGGRKFLAVSNVGLFYQSKEPPLVPDGMLCVGVRLTGDPSSKSVNSYFLWEVGKPPDVVIELVSDRRDGEDTEKLDKYCAIGVSYYAIFDPDKRLSEDVLRCHKKEGGSYVPMREPWFPELELGLTLWEASFEDHPATIWLRWCDRDGHVIPTGEERALAVEEKLKAVEAERAQDRHRLAKLEAQLRALGIDPNG